MLKLLFIVLFIATLLYGQETLDYQSRGRKDSISTGSHKNNFKDVKFELGVRDEILWMYTNLYNYNNGSANFTKSIYVPIDLHLTAGISFLEHYKIDFRIGIMYVYEDFTGLDKGIFFKADLFNTNFYGTVGIDFINNLGEGHGVTVYSEAGGKTTFLCIGAGYGLSKHFIFDLMYYYTKDKVYGYNIVSYSSTDYKRYDKINNGLLVLGFQYSFVF